MKKLQITRAAVLEVLREYWLQYKLTPGHTAVSFLMPALGTILVAYIPPLIVAHIINILAEQKTISLGSVGFQIFILSSVWMLGEAFWRMGMHSVIRVNVKGISNLSKISFKKLADRDYNFFSNNFVGSLTKQAISFSRGFDTFTETISYNVLNSVIPIFFAIFILWRYSPWIPLILITCTAVVFGCAVPLIRRRSKLVIARHEAGSKMTGIFSDALTNILAVKSFAREGSEHNRFAEIVDDYGAKYKKAADYQNLKFETVISPLYVFSNVFGLMAAVYFTGKFGLAAGTIVVVFSYYSSVTRSFWDFQRIYRGIESSISEAAEFTQLLLNPPAVVDLPHAPELFVTDATVSFENVGFHYSIVAKPEERFLKEFNLHIKSGEKIGLVGPSGGGKTTITKLILRFLDPQEGGIVIDGQNITEMTQESLRGAIAYVPQEPLLFHRSLFENIAYGKQNATKEEVIESAKLAHAHEFIENLPQGYDTLVGERGIKLSGGQRQRIAIARAMIKNAPILVLDEATSALDSESEKYIQQGLSELMKNKTALVIAHRLSTIKNLDRIVVLDQGKIVQDGTHHELIKKPGLYATLWSHQSGEFLGE